MKKGDYHMKVRKAVIPAAGLGTRFLPATKALAKEMLPIVDKPTIQFIVEEAKKSGIEDILIIEGKNKRSIEDHFDSAPELEQNLESKHKDALLKMVHVQLGSHGYQRIELAVVHANKDAAKFWVALGFQLLRQVEGELSAGNTQLLDVYTLNIGPKK